MAQFNSAHPRGIEYRKSIAQYLTDVPGLYIETWGNLSVARVFHEPIAKLDAKAFIFRKRARLIECGLRTSGH